MTTPDSDTVCLFYSMEGSCPHVLHVQCALFMPLMCFSGLLRSAMLLQLLKHRSNSSGSSGLSLEVFDFHACTQLEGGKHVWALCTVVCFAVGFPACVAILWAMFKTRRGGSPFSPNDFFTLNLSAMDAVFLAFIPPGFLNYYMLYNEAFEAIWNGVYSLNTCGRPLLMACACADCYLAVVHPITYCQRKSQTLRAVLAGVVWTVTVASGFVYTFFYKIFLTMFPMVPFAVAIVIIGVCDSFIIHTLINSDPGKNNTIHPQKQRAVQTLINSLVVAFISYLPPILLYTFGLPLIDDPNVFFCTIGLPVTVTSTLGSAVMPLLYLNNLGKLDRFRFGCCRKT